MTQKKLNVTHMVLSGMFIALAMVLPFLTGQIPQIGKALCPMHIPVILCGYFCGPFYGLVVGFISPLLRSVLFGMPAMIPGGVSMAFELATYGFVSGYLYKAFPKKKVYVYVSLIIAMLAGRAVWGVVRVILFGLGKSDFGWKAFMAGAFVNAIPGIILQLILIPVLVITLKKAFPDNNK